MGRAGDSHRRRCLTVAVKIGGSRKRDRNTVDSVQLIDPTTTPGQQPVGKTGLTLTFSDEFNGGALDRLKWDPWYPDTAFWNAPIQGYPGHKTNTDEPQVYDPSGITFDGSSMVFTMRNEASVPAPYATQWPFTSGMVTSYPSFNQAYGYFETRMRMPVGGGNGWPAFWMDRTDQVWPPEIDWMEFNIDGGSTVTQTYHHVSGATDHTPHLEPITDGSGWHVYGGEWRPGRLDWYIDGALTESFIDGTINSQPMYIICNLAWKSWVAPNPAQLPMSIYVDYIRAWA